MRKVGQVIAGLEHGWVHQRGQGVVTALLQGGEGELNHFFLWLLCQWLAVRGRSRAVLGAAYLAILQLEGQDDIVAIYLFLCDLGRNPALGGIGLPRPGANIVI